MTTRRQDETIRRICANTKPEDHIGCQHAARKTLAYQTAQLFDALEDLTHAAAAFFKPRQRQ